VLRTRAWKAGWASLRAYRRHGPPGPNGSITTNRTAPSKLGSGNYPSGIGSSGVFGSLDPFTNEPLSPIYINPLTDVAPFVLFQVLIVREEMRDLIS